jgi:hypothetical protein
MGVFLQPVTPSIVRVVEDPTPEVSYGGLLLSAVGVVGVLLLAGLVLGAIAGVLFFQLRRRRQLRDDSSFGSDAVQLNLNS